MTDEPTPRFTLEQYSAARTQARAAISALTFAARGQREGDDATDSLIGTVVQIVDECWDPNTASFRPAETAALLSAFQHFVILAIRRAALELGVPHETVLAAILKDDDEIDRDP